MALLLKDFTDHTINTGEVEIGYSIGPDNGPTLLMLHGVTSRRDGFLRVIPALAENHRIVTIDQRGHGYSGHTPVTTIVKITPGTYGSYWTTCVKNRPLPGGIQWAVAMLLLWQATRRSY